MIAPSTDNLKVSINELFYDIKIIPNLLTLDLIFEAVPYSSPSILLIRET